MTTEEEDAWQLQYEYIDWRFNVGLPVPCCSPLASPREENLVVTSTGAGFAIWDRKALALRDAVQEIDRD
jgi:hypothetical protein